MKRESKRRAADGAGGNRASARKRPTDGSSGRAMNLQQLREHVRKTQGDVARRADLSQPQLSRIEGRRDHLVSTLRKYVRALGGDVQVVAEIGVERIVLRDV
ncbi:MAG TPA: helix-turn-helix transcriptional regulator [Polyangia bacterium]|nr:helix-turn-helix transcriptional regulator [Polyangia bacterium]